MKRQEEDQIITLQRSYILHACVSCRFLLWGQHLVQKLWLCEVNNSPQATTKYKPTNNTFSSPGKQHVPNNSRQQLWSIKLWAMIGSTWHPELGQHLGRTRAQVPKLISITTKARLAMTRPTRSTTTESERESQIRLFRKQPPQEQPRMIGNHARNK